MNCQSLIACKTTDSLKRYYELNDKKVILSTGTDEHGLKIQQAAAKVNQSPQEFCDNVSERFRELFDMANISYTTFIRTTEQKHKDAVKFFWEQLVNNGYIYKGVHEGWYSISDEAFYNASQVQISNSDEKIASVLESGQLVEWTEEENYKFRLSKCKDELLRWLDENPDVITPSNRFNEVKAFIKSDLVDISVSRPQSRLYWGIPVPKDSNQTIYVWLDALINYLTVTGYPWQTQENSVNKHSMSGWPVDVHIVGKDIIRFHAVYWPAFLMAANLPLPKKILAHSHWMMNKLKMSKSRGNVVDPFTVMKEYGVDTIRYYLMRDGGISDDGAYDPTILQTRYRKDLAGQLGNLVSRSTSLALNPSSTVPFSSSFIENVNDKDITLIKMLQQLPDLVNNHYKNIEFGKGLELIFETIAEA
ncbi:1462_t:CDS:10, partial [Dentiscutata erythropus]